MITQKIQLIICLFLCLVRIGSTEAQHLKNTNEHSLFTDQAILNITLKADFTQLTRTKEQENYFKGECTIHWSESDSINQPIKTKARGYYRKINCSFPPLMLNFKPDSLFTSDGQFGKIKLVTHCQKSKIYRDYILKEYLIYQLYELICSNSLRTRLVEINYQDTGTKKKDQTNIGFLIEPVDALCNRVDALEIKTAYFKDSEINSLDADRIALFMYMIGNTDWRIKGGHNIKFIKPLTHKILQVTPVPYDFDHSGFINTGYAKPSEWSIAKDVTERDFLGKCRINELTYDQLIPEFLENEPLIYQTILEFEWLEQKSRKQLIKYIEGFFDQLRNPERFKRYLQHTCLNNY